MSLKKRIILLILITALGAALLTACFDTGVGSQGTTKSTAGNTIESASEVITCKYVLPGDKPVEYEAVEEMINEKMLADGVGVKLQRQYIAWDAWDQKVNIMLSTGEEFDLLNVMNDVTPISFYVSKGALTDITEYMNQYGSAIKKVNPDIMIEAAKVKDRIYAIPAFWVEFSHSPEMTIRLDILKKYNLPVPKSFEELTETFQIVMEKWEGDRKPYIPLIGSKVYKFGLDHKSYDTWPFWVYDDIFYVNQNTSEVKCYFETEEFKQDCQNANDWYKKGLINPDVLVFKSEHLNSQLDSGDWFGHAGTYGNSIDNIKKNYPNITVDDFEFLNFFPNKPNLRPYGTRNMNAVPVTSKNPEAGVKFINWLYSNQDNYDLYLYGREGIDYIKKGDRKREDIIDLAKGRPLYFADDWMIGNLNFSRQAGNSPAATSKILFNVDETAVDSIAGGFVFDATSIQAELANVRTEIAAYMTPIACGVVEYDKAYPEAIEKLRAAGLEKVMNTYRTQFEAYKAANKK